MRATIRLGLVLACVVATAFTSGCSSRVIDRPGLPEVSRGAASSVEVEEAAVLEVIAARTESALGQPVTNDGEPFDYSKMPAFADAFKPGAFDDHAIALLKKAGSTWTVLEFEIGSTDILGRSGRRSRAHRKTCSNRSALPNKRVNTTRTLLSC